MKIQVLFFAELREMFGASHSLVVPDKIKAGEVTDYFSHDSKTYFLKKQSLVYAINETFEMPDTELKEGDCLAIMMPMSGG